MNPGSIVTCRNREWVLLPSDRQEVFLLRPLTGATDDVVAVHKGLANLIGAELPAERVASATFPLPTTADLADAGSAHLLWQAARLTLREGATPLRSLGRISIRPRVYQFVPLLMALRLDPVRLFIADDVGVGKTIEALLVAREMLDRGEIKRLCVLAPPSLCDQWQAELSQKMNLDAVVIRSGTVSQLERRKASAESIYRYYPIQIVSIDFVKSDRNRHLFLQDCPELVIVDEAHGTAAASATNQSQQQRHELLRAIAARNEHLMLLTATPHSGVDAAFRSLIGLLQPEFGTWDMGTLDDDQRTRLARHFVQRTRRNIEEDWEGEHCFPTRVPGDETYTLSKPYRQLFDKTFDFCSEIVRGGATLDRRRQRVRYWGALALLRCVMSSPAAAMAALEARHSRLGEAASDEEPDFGRLVFESADDQTDDEQPIPAVEAAEETLADADRHRLRELGRIATTLVGTANDTKLARCVEIVSGLVRDGFNPIVWCRYIATADYVAEGLRKDFARSKASVQVTSVTGHLGDDERKAKIAEIDSGTPRVLVATDCLSEGINLQDMFNAAVHYDLPWNPNRLEQREGRVDRFGQPSKTVKAIRFFGADNPVDGVVIEVLLDKAREIHKALGTHVPVPEESETVTQAVLNALFLRRRKEDAATQLAFDLDSGVSPHVEKLHAQWQRDADREKINRSRFAQRAIKPDEVRRELEATDDVLGDPGAVREFVLSAAQRIGLTVTPDKRKDAFRIHVSGAALETVPEAVRFSLPALKSANWTVSFSSPTSEGAEYLGRNHTFVASVARFLMEEALTRHGAARASRCGVLRTRAVTRRIHLLLLRVRYLVEQPQRAPLLAEEVLVTAFEDGVDPAEVGRSSTRGSASAGSWIDDPVALALLADAKPDANIPMAEKTELAQAALRQWPAIEKGLQTRLLERAHELEQSHKRIRQAVHLRVRDLKVVPQTPPDLLGLLVLDPLLPA